MIHLKNLQVYTNTHCNLKCAECMYHSQFAVPYTYSFDKFKEDILLSTKLFSFDVAILIGGEPLLNKELGKYAEFLKSNNLCKSIQINTNGILLDRFDGTLYDNIDRIVVSKYPLTDNLSSRIESGIEHVKSYPHIKLDVIPFDFFLKTTVTTRRDDITTQEVWKRCTCGLYSTYGYNGVVFNGKFYRCVLSFMKPYFFNQLGLKEDYSDLIEADSFLLESQTSENFELFYMDKNPLKACYWCNGCSGKKTDHSQIKNISELVSSSVEDLDFDYSYKDDRKNLMDHSV